MLRKRSFSPRGIARISSPKRARCRPMRRAILQERGTSFGYNNLIVDMLGIAEMKKLGVPVTMDATQRFSFLKSRPRTAHAQGERIHRRAARRCAGAGESSAVAAGANGVFLEFHPEPDSALCDAPSCLPSAAHATCSVSLRSCTKR